MIVSLYAALLTLMYLALAAYVVKGRLGNQIVIGDGENMKLRSRIRAHANFAEYTPLFLLLLAFIEVDSFPDNGIHALGTTFIIGRLFHMYGLLVQEQYEGGKLTTSAAWRTRGMIITLTVMSVMAGILLWKFTLDR